jgi:phage tail sheath gpL-like
MKPFIALVGDTSGEDTLASGRENEVTNSFCTALESPAHPLEVAANYALLFARVAQSTPHLDIGGLSLPDLPVYTSYEEAASYSYRDALMKAGISTSYVVNGKYEVQDFITTYSPSGEAVPQFRYCRNLMVDFNIKFGYYLLELINVLDHAIVNNDDVVSASKVIKPKQWVGIINKYADDLSLRALISDPSFMQDSIQVAISSVNPDRLETFFRYKRSGVARISATTAEAGFNFGTNN